jgi:pimeloyl-ACP methyl ester carboxylesterase
MTTVAQTRTIHTVQGGGGLRLHVREWGKADGPPILFIHGLSQSHLCWAKQYQSSLAEEFRLVAYDLRGHGMSEAPLEPEHYSDGALWADDVAAIIDQLRLDRPVVVGWSYGGFVISPTSPPTTCRPTSAACAAWSRPSRPSRSRPTTSRRCCAPA